MENQVIYRMEHGGLVKVTPVKRVRKSTAEDYVNQFTVPDKASKVPSKIKLWKKFEEDLMNGESVYVVWKTDKGEDREALVQKCDSSSSSGSLLVHNLSIALGLDTHSNGSTNSYTRIPVNHVVEYSTGKTKYYV